MTLLAYQRPRVLLKTLMVLESVLLHGPDRALEESIDMKTDIKAPSPSEIQPGCSRGVAEVYTAGDTQPIPI